MDSVVCGMKWLKMEKLYILGQNYHRMESFRLEKMMVLIRRLEQRKKT